MGALTKLASLYQDMALIRSRVGPTLGIFKGCFPP